MKKYILIVCLLFAVFSANAQFVSGPSKFSMITNAGTWTVAASNGATVAVNIPSTQAPWITVGKDSFGVYVKAYATNAAHTTNTWFTLECSADGVNAITNNTLTVCYLPTGVATNTYYTNFVISTSALLGNIQAVRLKNVMSTNGVIGSSLAGNLFVEQFRLNTR
jgi:hypothetical protein